MGGAREIQAKGGAVDLCQNLIEALRESAPITMSFVYLRNVLKTKSLLFRLVWQP
jgi:hypothetical protein